MIFSIKKTIKIFVYINFVCIFVSKTIKQIITIKTLIIMKTGNDNKNRFVWVQAKGSFYLFKTECKTLKEVMGTYPLYQKRAWVKDWGYYYI